MQHKLHVEDEHTYHAYTNSLRQPLMVEQLERAYPGGDRDLIQQVVDVCGWA